MGRRLLPWLYEEEARAGAADMAAFHALVEVRGSVSPGACVCECTCALKAPPMCGMCTTTFH